MRDVRTINLTAVWGRELCYVSGNEGFRFLEIWVHFASRFEPADLAVHYEVPLSFFESMLDIFEVFKDTLQLCWEFWNRKIQHFCQICFVWAGSIFQILQAANPHTVDHKRQPGQKRCW